MDHYDKFDNKITVLPIIDSPRYAAKSEDLLAIDYTNVRSYICSGYFFLINSLLFSGQQNIP